MSKSYQFTIYYLLLVNQLHYCDNGVLPSSCISLDVGAERALDPELINTENLSLLPPSWHKWSVTLPNGSLGYVAAIRNMIL